VGDEWFLWEYFATYMGILYIRSVMSSRKGTFQVYRYILGVRGVLYVQYSSI
jgi:hypothetical protein